MFQNIKLSVLQIAFAFSINIKKNLLMFCKVHVNVCVIKIILCGKNIVSSKYDEIDISIIIIIIDSTTSIYHEA